VYTRAGEDSYLNNQIIIIIKRHWQCLLIMIIICIRGRELLLFIIIKVVELIIIFQLCVMEGTPCAQEGEKQDTFPYVCTYVRMYVWKPHRVQEREKQDTPPYGIKGIGQACQGKKKSQKSVP
jgi:hypothetical protein